MSRPRKRSHGGRRRADPRRRAARPGPGRPERPPRDPASPAASRAGAPSPDYFRWTSALFDPSKIFDKPEALRGVRVLELTTLVLGPTTADFLGELGAEVIKVELPPRGDTMRFVTPEGTFWKNASLGFFPENHSKYHVGIDLHGPEGKALFRQLGAKSDILVENFRAGTLDAWGIGYRDMQSVNAGLIYVADSGFGQWGPFAQGRPSYDAVAQTVSGMIGISGFPGRPPILCGIFIGDWFGGLMAATAALVALHHRSRTGEGQLIDLAQSEGLVRTLDWTWVRAGLTGANREPAGNRDTAIGVADIFDCRDGHVAVAAGSDGEFRGLCAALGDPALARDPRYVTLEARQHPDHALSLLGRVREWARGLTRAEVETAAAKHGFAAARVATARDRYEDEHLRARGSVWEYEDPLYGQMVEHGPAPKLSETPARIKWAAKPVGWHNHEVFTRILGLAPSRIQALREEKVIGQWAEIPGARPPADWTPDRGRV